MSVMAPPRFTVPRTNDGTGTQGDCRNDAPRFKSETRFRHLLQASPPGRSGYGQAQHRDASRAAGFDHHLVKPIDPYELQALLAP